MFCQVGLLVVERAKKKCINFTEGWKDRAQEGQTEDNN